MRRSRTSARLPPVVRWIDTAVQKNCTSSVRIRRSSPASAAPGSSPSRISSDTRWNSSPTGGTISSATSRMAPPRAWPARMARVIMSMASGNWVWNSAMRCCRRYIKKAIGSAPVMTPAISAQSAPPTRTEPTTAPTAAKPAMTMITRCGVQVYPACSRRSASRCTGPLRSRRSGFRSSVSHDSVVPARPLSRPWIRRDGRAAHQMPTISVTNMKKTRPAMRSAINAPALDIPDRRSRHRPGFPRAAGGR